MPVQVNISAGENGAALCRPSGYLGGEVFPRYLAAVKAGGGKFVKDLKAHAFPLENLPGMISEIERAGFLPVVADDVLGSVRERVVEIRADQSEARDRIRAVTAALAGRGLKPRRYQEIGIEWLAGRTRGLLGDQPALGKTFQALLAADPEAPVLVVCPEIMKGRILKDGTRLGGWAAEIEKFCPERRITILKGRKSFRWPLKGEAVVINYDILPSTDVLIDAETGGVDADAAMALTFEELEARSKGCLPGTVLIADEAHRLKNRKSQRSQKFRDVATQVEAGGGRRWGLTGTPMTKDNAPQLWSVLTALGLEREAFGDWPTFVRIMGGKPQYIWRKGPDGKPRPEQRGYIWGTPEAEAAERLRRVMLARRRDDVLPDLPRIQRKVAAVHLSASARKLCDEAVRRLAAEGIDLRASLDLATLRRVDTAGFTEISAARKALAAAKIDDLMELADDFEEQEEPVVFFSYHRAPLLALGARPGWGLIIGGAAEGSNKVVEAEFLAGRLKGVACSIMAGGVGIDLSRAACGVFVDRAWTPGDNDQAELRLPRKERAGCVTITDVVADHPLDFRVREVLVEAQEVIEAVVDAAAVSGDTVVDPAAALERIADSS